MGVAYALNTPPPLPRFHPPREEQIHPVKNTKPELKSDLQTQSCHAFVTLIPQCASISSLYQLFLSVHMQTTFNLYLVNQLLSFGNLGFVM